MMEDVLGNRGKKWENKKKNSLKSPDGDNVV